MFVSFVGLMVAMAAFLKKWGVNYLTRSFKTTNAIIGLIPAKWIKNLNPKQ